MKTYKMKRGVSLGPITVYSNAQKRTLGRLLSDAVAEDRTIELRQDEDGGSIYVLLSAADDLGKVFKVDELGEIKQIGTTEAKA